MSEQQIGQIPIDTGRLALVDPMNLADVERHEDELLEILDQNPETDRPMPTRLSSNEHEVAVAVVLATGLGDGLYPLEGELAKQRKYGRKESHDHHRANRVDVLTVAKERGLNMFARTKAIGQPQKAFVHRDDCKLLRADPGIEIPWNEVRAGYWEARGVCGVEGWHAPNAGRVRRNDPYDPATARHLGQCAFIGLTDEAISAPAQGHRQGRLRLGPMRLLRRRLAGCALRRGECRVTEDLGVCGRRAAD
jgi:hypothetical protein